MRKIAQRFGVDPSTVQRISRFVAGSVTSTTRRAGPWPFQFERIKSLSEPPVDWSEKLDRSAWESTEVGRSASRTTPPDSSVICLLMVVAPKVIRIGLPRDLAACFYSIGGFMVIDL